VSLHPHCHADEPSRLLSHCEEAVAALEITAHASLMVCGHRDPTSARRARQAPDADRCIVIRRVAGSNDQSHVTSIECIQMARYAPEVVTVAERP
jgi:hypothetical protein